MDKERFTIIGLNTNEAIAKMALAINRLLKKAPRKIGVSIPSVPYCFYHENIQPGQAICSVMAPVPCKVRNLMFYIEDGFFKSALITISLESNLGYEQIYSVDLTKKEDSADLPITLEKGDRVTIKLATVEANLRDHVISSLKRVWLSFTLDITRPVSEVAKLSVEAINEGL